MKRYTAKPKFKDRQKKLLVAESLLPGASLLAIARRNKIDLDTLKKWQFKYEHDRIVTSMVQKFNTINNPYVPETKESSKMVVLKEEVLEEAFLDKIIPNMEKVIPGKKRQFTTLRKLEILAEANATSARAVMNKYQLSDPLFYKWKKQYTDTILPVSGLGQTPSSEPHLDIKDIQQEIILETLRNNTNVMYDYVERPVDAFKIEFAVLQNEVKLIKFTSFLSLFLLFVVAVVFLCILDYTF